MGASRGTPLKALQRSAIDLDAEARPVRDRHHARHVLERRRQDRLAKRMFRAIEFQQGLARAEAWRIVRKHGQQLEGRGQANSPCPTRAARNVSRS